AHAARHGLDDAVRSRDGDLHFRNDRGGAGLDHGGGLAPAAVRIYTHGGRGYSPPVCGPAGARATRRLAGPELRHPTPRDTPFDACRAHDPGSRAFPVHGQASGRPRGWTTMSVLRNCANPRNAMTAKPKLSIACPAYEEEEGLPFFHDELCAVLDELKSDHELEILYVDDGSKDGTLAVLKELVARDGRVRYLSLSRNFGHQAALTAGFDHAT